MNNVHACMSIVDKVKQLSHLKVTCVVLHTTHQYYNIANIIAINYFLHLCWESKMYLIFFWLFFVAVSHSFILFLHFWTKIDFYTFNPLQCVLKIRHAIQSSDNALVSANKATFALAKETSLLRFSNMVAHRLN